MKSKVFYYFLLLSIFSCNSLFEGNNRDGYRDGSESGILINGGSLIGRWEETYKWNNGGGEFRSEWNIVDIKYSDNYEFLADGTFTSTKNINDCLGTTGTYLIEGTKLTLKYNCEPGVTKEVLINEFFFREKHIVFIKGEGTSDISKFELIK